MNVEHISREEFKISKSHWVAGGGVYTHHDPKLFVSLGGIDSVDGIVPMALAAKCVTNEHSDPLTYEVTFYATKAVAELLKEIEPAVVLTEAFVSSTRGRYKLFVAKLETTADYLATLSEKLQDNVQLARWS